MSVDDFIISYFVTGGGVKNLSIMVYTMSKRVNPSINAISTLVVVIITLVLLVINLAPVLASKRENKEEISGRKKMIPLAVGAVALVAILIFSSLGGSESSRKYEGQTLHVYNWGEYTGENIISDFEEETGCTVVMENL